MLHRSDSATRVGLASWLQRSAGNRSVTTLVAQRAPEEGHRLHELHGGQAEREADSWDPMILSTFGQKTYGEYTKTVLQGGTFFGQTVAHLHPDLNAVLQQIETKLKDSQGAGYKVPSIDSGFRAHKGMHGLGMAVDFDVLENPYVLNESGEAELDKDLVLAYDHIAQFMLGDPQSSLRKLKRGRAAFGTGSIGDVWEALHRESVAMTQYFNLRGNSEALSNFLEHQWPASHPKQAAPDIAVVKAQMAKDYETLGGKTAGGGKLPTGGKGDRPFAPTSGGGAGDPGTGFLNLPKEFVQAMTDAGLAWGAIDIKGEPGDIQHFDLRLMGLGKTA
ncbi:MAG TPA: hypothetical protein VNB49_08385, partial [Candidatus Dormibacteraeota bacterium]|nr:hypothetical protein [Candidatus Dormibacteraeota bacterium]